MDGQTTYAVDLADLLTNLQKSAHGSQTSLGLHLRVIVQGKPAPLEGIDWVLRHEGSTALWSETSLSTLPAQPCAPVAHHGRLLLEPKPAAVLPALALA